LAIFGFATWAGIRKNRTPHKIATAKRHQALGGLLGRTTTNKPPSLELLRKAADVCVRNCTFCS
jgi:hypothetical protein